MRREEYDELVTKSNKIINKYILESKKFIEYACFPYGKLNHAISGEKDAHYTYDFEYFAFTKSTKTLMSVRTLLKNNLNEDVLILLRSILENYISCRYFTEHDMMIDEFIFNPILLANRIYYYDSKTRTTRDRDGNTIDYEQKQPSQLKLGEDKRYFYELYEYLCNYAHCNYSVIECYLDKSNNIYTCELDKNSLLTRILTIFIFNKIFEQVVTVEGEDFPDKKTEKNCYKLVKDTTIFLDEVLAKLKDVDCNINKHLKKHMKNMFEGMRKSLKEEIGSLKKDFLDEINM